MSGDHRARHAWHLTTSTHSAVRALWPARGEDHDRPADEHRRGARRWVKTRPDDEAIALREPKLDVVGARRAGAADRRRAAGGGAPPRRPGRRARPQPPVVPRAHPGLRPGRYGQRGGQLPARAAGDRLRDQRRAGPTPLRRTRVRAGRRTAARQAAGRRAGDPYRRPPRATSTRRGWPPIGPTRRITRAAGRLLRAALHLGHHRLPEGRDAHPPRDAGARANVAASR